ncbi:YicC/YloC family endoribonuclease [Pseudoflavonifractor phocaeensis]|uniref:YicC/YloC family endoribonuclease n=1 Tax=Pseudoflavonifractor phocaeensis TaxID=1870988 RepID=UPI00313D93D8
MIKSMTGYGRGESVWNGHAITAEIRSVNNRYLDCVVKLPRMYNFAEDAVKAAVQQRVSRGKVEVYLSVGPSETGGVSISVNRPVADGYYSALRELADAYSLADDISVSLLSRFPDVFLVERTEEDRDEAVAGLLEALSKALDEFDAMREREGAKLAEDVRNRAETIKQLTAQVEERAPGIVADYRAKLTAKLQEILGSTQIDESRILTEAAIYADKVAVDEETVRLRSHLDQLAGMLEQGGSVGRKLDFLIQEFNREANTIGSKCNDVETGRLVVDIKAEIEKIREQIQNLE